VIETPPTPDFDNLPEQIGTDLDARFDHIPFDRVRRMADYWALREVEADHIRKLARRNDLSAEEGRCVEVWWLARLGAQLTDTLDRMSLENRENNLRLLGRHARRMHSKFLFQLWFNTIGPGGRCWFGNRYTTIRHYTFRLHWWS